MKYSKRKLKWVILSIGASFLEKMKAELHAEGITGDAVWPHLNAYFCCYYTASSKSAAKRAMSHLMKYSALNGDSRDFFSYRFDKRDASGIERSYLNIFLDKRNPGIKCLRNDFENQRWLSKNQKISGLRIVPIHGIVSDRFKRLHIYYEGMLLGTQYEDFGIDLYGYRPYKIKEIGNLNRFLVPSDIEIEVNPDYVADDSLSEAELNSWWGRGAQTTAIEKRKRGLVD